MNSFITLWLIIFVNSLIQNQVDGIVNYIINLVLISYSAILLALILKVFFNFEILFFLIKIEGQYIRRERNITSYWY